MEKQANKLNKILVLHKPLLILYALFFVGFFGAHAQDRIPFDQGTKYFLGNIKVTGKISYNEQTVVTFAGLEKGQEVTIPGEEISNAIKKLGKLGLFSEIDFYVNKIEGDSIFLELNINELPKLNEVKIVGVKKSKKETLIKDNALTKGKIVNENLITTTRNYIENKYRKDGFYNTKVTVSTKADTTQTNQVNMLIFIDKGNKIKINSIDFTGNTMYTDAQLRKRMKNTKQKNVIRIFKASKYIKDKYKEDLVKVIDKYKENGYRDARIVSDTLDFTKNKKELTLKINVEEGRKYYFGNIKFLGNTIYPDRGLQQMLGIKKGDIYNGVLLEKRIADKSKPDGDDITNLYQNNGYLFSTINAVEVKTANDTIDFEIRIVEGPLAYFNKITVVGNDRTNDKVIYRELRTKPGQKYSKEELVRTIREIGQLGFFDPEAIDPKFKNVDAAAGTVDIEYNLVEKGSSQIELQGGYGGGSSFCSRSSGCCFVNRCGCRSSGFICIWCSRRICCSRHVSGFSRLFSFCSLFFLVCGFFSFGFGFGFSVGHQFFSCRFAFVQFLLAFSEVGALIYHVFFCFFCFFFFQLFFGQLISLGRPSQFAHYLVANIIAFGNKQHG